MRDTRRALLLVCAGLVALVGAWPATSRAQNLGFQLNRYEPTTVGSWSFAVEHPWYSYTRDLAAGITLNYAHDPLVFGNRDASGNFSQTQVVIEHSLMMHVDLAAAVDRLNISLSLPVTMLERGNEVSGFAPLAGGAMGDPRLGLLVRLLGQPSEDAFSLSLGGYVWFPIGAANNHTGDANVRVMPEIVTGGLAFRHMLWSLTAAYYYRPDAELVANLLDTRGSTRSQELLFGGQIAYADMQRRFAVGPEILVSTGISGEHPGSKDTTGLDILLGAHYNLASQVQAGLALGIGTLRDPGTPDFRLLFRLAYAPIKPPPQPVNRCEGCAAPPPPPVVQQPCPACPACAPPPPPPPPPAPKPVCQELDDKDQLNFTDGAYDLKGSMVRNRKVIADLMERINGLVEPGTEEVKIYISGHTSHSGPALGREQMEKRAANNPNFRYREYLDWVHQVEQNEPGKIQEWLDAYQRTWGPVLKWNEEDSRHNVLFNQWLSEKRAETVWKLVDEARRRQEKDRQVQLRWRLMTPEGHASGHGMTQPRALEKGKAAQEENRRVEFEIKHKNCVSKHESPAQNSQN